ncbi:ABC transporter permease [Terrisporobacter sp.]|uniref:ABC transporter permease n=1 Tax=Terrisporobacter sp. TaxID=1965305 RepID=UPI00260C4D06|nr:ABC transporter permease [Terrisporobacter sp.]
MTLFYLIKKEIKQFFENKIYVVTMFIFPLIIIMIMGTTLDGHMSMDNNIFRDKIIYYRISNSGDKELKFFYNFMVEFEKQTNVNFIQADKIEVAIKKVNNNKAISFIELNGDSYKYFRNENKESSESKIFRNIFEQCHKKYALLEGIGRNNPNELEKIINNQISIFLISDNIQQEEVNSFTYYTFTQLTLIILYISIITYLSIYQDKNSYRISNFKNLKSNDMNKLISKLILGLVIGILQILIIYFISIKFLHANWGKDLLTVFIVLISFIIFSSILGISIFNIFSNYKTAIIMSNILIVVMGFLGGAYAPIYLLESSNVTSFLSKLSPTYWINISLLSLSNGLNTNYPIISICFFMGISILLLIICYVTSKEKVGVRVD